MCEVAAIGMFLQQLRQKMFNYTASKHTTLQDSKENWERKESGEQEDNPSSCAPVRQRCKDTFTNLI